MYGECLVFLLYTFYIILSNSWQFDNMLDYAACMHTVETQPSLSPIGNHIDTRVFCFEKDLCVRSVVVCSVYDEFH